MLQACDQPIVDEGLEKEKIRVQKVQQATLESIRRKVLLTLEARRSIILRAYRDKAIARNICSEMDRICCLMGSRALGIRIPRFFNKELSYSFKQA